MKIGELIHENGWTTYVSSGNPCTSSCSIIWLAGTPRTIEGAPAVIIGFHAIYNKETEQESGAANAILGHHLARWGLNELGVACVTISPPNEMGWLTGVAGRECGITWQVFSACARCAIRSLTGANAASSATCTTIAATPTANSAGFKNGRSMS